MTPTRDEALEAAERIKEAVDSFLAKSILAKDVATLARFVLAEPPPSPGEGEAEVRKDLAVLVNMQSIPSASLINKVAAHCENLLTENARLRAGQFTEAEFQNLCHNLTTEDRCRFEAGCREYQDKLFGPKELARRDAGGEK